MEGKRERLLMVDRLTPGDGSRICLGSFSPPAGQAAEPWFALEWLSNGDGGRIVQVSTMLYEFHEAVDLLGADLAGLSPLSLEATDGDDVSVGSVLLYLEGLGYKLVGELPSPGPCPPDKREPWKPGANAATCRSCGEVTETDPEDGEAYLCNAEGCARTACGGWSYLCCEHGKSKVEECLEILKRMRR